MVAGPYREQAVNVLYNLLFCDDLELFRGSGAAVVLGEDVGDEEVARIARDEGVESRVRVLAYNRLRARKVEVPRGQVLGVIVEVPLEGGLDVLAVYVDGRMRYINQSGKVSIFESTPVGMEGKVEALLEAARAAVAVIGPWDKARLAPPTGDKIRMTFLVSDGLYFGEGAFAVMERDPIGAPIVQAATQLLVAIVSA